MNLKDLLGRLERALQFAANTQARVDDFTEELNDRYLELCSEHPWPFLDRVETRTVYPDITGMTGTVTLNSQAIVITAGGTPAAYWVGHELHATTTGQKFTINGVDTATGTVYVDEPYSSSTTPDTFALKLYKYQLPQDAQNVLGVITRSDDLGKMRALDRETEELAYLDPDESSSTPEMWILEDEALDRAPRTPITTTATGGGSLAVGTEYRYLYVRKLQGRLSSPSLVASATPSGLNTSIRLTGLEDTGTNTGIDLSIYREEGRDGLFKHLTTLTSGTATYLDTGAATPSETNLFNMEGPYRYFRLWPRTESQRDMQIRYQVRPKRLRHDTDVPVLPVQFHSLLVHLAALNLCHRYGGAKLADYHRRAAEKLLGKMTRRSQDDDREYQVGQWTSAGYTRARTTTATLDA